MHSQLLRVILVQICIGSAISGMRLAVPLLALKQGQGALAVGLLVALFALTQVILALPAGRFADRHGARLPLTLALCASVASLLIAAVFPFFGALCVSALLSGASVSVGMLTTQRHVGRTASNVTELKHAFSWLSVAPSIGNFLGPFSVGLLIDHAGPQPNDLLAYRIAFAAMILFPLAGYLATRGVHEAPKEPPRPQPDGDPHPPAWDMLRVPTFRRLLVVNWMQGASWDVHLLAVPLLGVERGLSASTIGAILGVFAIASTTVRVLLPMLASRLSERNIITASTLATAVLFSVYPFVESAILMGCCSALLGLALGAVQPMVLTLLYRTTPAARQGEALALRLMTVQASSVVIPLAMGTAGAVIGITGIFWIVSALMAGGTRVVRVLPAHEEELNPPPDT